MQMEMRAMGAPAQCCHSGPRGGSGVPYPARGRSLPARHPEKKFGYVLLPAFLGLIWPPPFPLFFHPATHRTHHKTTKSHYPDLIVHTTSTSSSTMPSAVAEL